MKMEDHIRQKHPLEYQMAAKEWDAVPQRSGIRIFHEVRSLDEANTHLYVKQMIEDRFGTVVHGAKKELEGRKRKLANLFETANKVIIENNASLNRFNEKIGENLTEMAVMSDQIDQAKSDMLHYAKIKEDMERYVKQYSDRYEVFLEKVAESALDFENIGNVLMRFETIENCRKECERVLQEELEGAAELRKEMLTLAEERSTVLKILNNDLVTLELRSKEAKMERKEWEHVLKRIKDEVTTSIEVSNNFSCACYDLYVNVCRKRKVRPTLPIKDTENQLKFIQKSIMLAKDVIRIATAVHQQQSSNAAKITREQKVNIRRN